MFRFVLEGPWQRPFLGQKTKLCAITIPSFQLASPSPLDGSCLSPERADLGAIRRGRAASQIALFVVIALRKWCAAWFYP